MDSTFLIKAGQLLLSLSILVVLHEMGHFLPAKWFKTRVEKFYLFFNPWFSLFKTKVGDTEYGIGWLPLGGYVKISGMIDESMDKEQMKKPAEPWEFRSKPAWQRLIIMIGGVTVNLILGILIYSSVLFFYGEDYLPNKNLKDGVWCVDSVAYNLGLENGDKIVSVDGQEIEKFSDVFPKILLGESYTVERNGQEIVKEVPVDFIEKMIDSKSRMVLYPRIPMVIAAIPDSSHNADSGLQEKDRIIAFNGEPITYFDEYKTLSKQHKSETVRLKIDRDGLEKEVEVTLDEKGFIGIMPALYSYSDLQKANVYEFESIEYGFFAAIPAGIEKALNKLGFYINQFKLILNPETGAYKGVGGFGAIGNLFPPTWEWQAFWEITAFLSLILAFMNILPIPALDGGHVMFLLYEIVAGRAPGEKFMEYAQLAGMLILLSLLIFANANDLIRAFG